MIGSEDPTDSRSVRAAAAPTPPAPPNVGTRAPYRFRHGPHEVTVFSDGQLMLPTTLLAPQAPAADRRAALEIAGLVSENYEPAANIPLIRSGEDLILFDTGGVDFQPGLGWLSRHLTTSGIDAGSITKVVLTHGHPDHIWGTVLADGALRFPNATYYAGAAEWDFWNHDDVWTKLPDAQRPFAIGARRQYAAVRDRVIMMRSGDEVISGIRAIATPGHTPGHLSFEVSGGDGLIIVGDVVTTPSVYFPNPKWTFGFDADDGQAIDSRVRLLDRAARERTILLGYHWPYPGVGYAERDGAGYHYLQGHDRPDTVE
ncbi:Glyoxylase, beta-lactamase superfamily II [Methylobacterium sp. 190mf]|nr:Glyoxylase, beta-lactamase superfamily II [Methylobacterium sp. 190mf]